MTTAGLIDLVTQDRLTALFTSSLSAMAFSFGLMTARASA